MAEGSFQLNSLFIKRLRRILITIAVLFLIGIISSYYSSQGYLKGLQKINSANKTLNLSSLTLESIETSDQNLNKILSNRDLETIEFSFFKSLELANLHLNQAIASSDNFPEAKTLLLKAGTAIKNYNKAVNSLLKLAKSKRYSASFANLIKSDLVIAGEFSADAREDLRIAQIYLKKMSNMTFYSIYNNRFVPLIVATILSICFFGFVITVGLATAKRLARNLENLTSATDKVASGNLNFQAPILESDEFGKLTFEFNRMVSSLHEKQQKLNLTVQRITRLQQLTSSFAETISSEEVFEVIFKETLQTLGVNAGLIGLLDTEKKNIIVHRMEGYHIKEVPEIWKIFPLTAQVPMADAINSGNSLFFATQADLFKTYPQLSESYLKGNVRASAAVPLFVEGEAVGCIIFDYREEQTFDPAYKKFLLALVSQCSQAYHRSKLYEAAKEAVKVRDEFLSIASHELRTPLTPLKLQLQSLTRQISKGNLETISEDKLKKTVSTSVTQVNRLTTLIDDLLDVSRISAGKLTLNLELVNLSEMIEEVLGHYSHQLKQKNSSVEYKTDSSLVGHFDKVRIEQVFINLLTNATKYAPGKPIHVLLERSGNNAKLIVKDEGEGISPQNQVRIFNRFERVKDRDNIGGLGLGLYISKQIVEAHHGSIRVESKPGHGASFIVELPLNGTIYGKS